MPPPSFLWQAVGRVSVQNLRVFMTMPNPPSQADWSGGRKTGVAILALAIFALLPATYQMARPFLSALLLAGILAVALDPLKKTVARRVSRSPLAALIPTVVAVAPILGFVLLGGVVIEREIRSGAFSVSGVFHAGQWLTASAPIDSRVIQRAVVELAGGLFTAVLSIIFLYVLLMHGHKWVAQSTALLPLDSAVTNRIVTTIQSAIVANVNGIIAVAAADGCLCGIVFWLAGVGSPVLWGACAGLASMVPIIGSALVWLPMAVTLAIHKAWIKAAIVAAGCFAGQEGVAMLLRPRVVGQRVGQSPLLIALSVVGATDAFGALGILLGPVIIAVLAALVREFQIQLQPADAQTQRADPT